MTNPVLHSFIPDNLLFGDEDLCTDSVSVSAGNLKRGSVLGQVTRSVPTTGTADGGNTGAGTCTLVAARRYTQTGTYTVICTVANVTFEIQDPSGHVVGLATVGTLFDNREIALQVNDTGTNFIVGDKFTIAVTVGSFACKLVDKGASDGSQTAKFVLLNDTDATSAAKLATVAKCGSFNEAALIFAAGNTIEDHRETLRSYDIQTRLAGKSGSMV